MKNRFSGAACAALAIAFTTAAVTGVVSPACAQASVTKVNFSIPAGPLDAAIVQLGRQGGVMIAILPETVRGKQTSGLRGGYTTSEALERLLQGTSLSAQPDGRGGFVIRQVAVERVVQRSAKPVAETVTSGPEDIAEVVVVGQTTSVLVGAKQLEQTQANDLADIFRNTPSVSVGGSVGIAQKVYVRGMEDTLLNVTVDGAPQTGTLFHHIGRVQIEPELMKSVKLQAGAGEATSGFGAVGGALRFRTKSAEDLLSEGEPFGMLGKASWFSNNGYKGSVTAYGRLSDNWSLLGSLVYVDRDDMQDGDGDRLYGTAAEQALGFLKLSGKLAPNHFLSVSYEHRDEEGKFGQRPNWPALEGAILYPAEAGRRTTVANYRNELGDLVNMDVTAYYTRAEFTQDIFTRWGRYGAKIDTFGFDVRNTSRFGAHELIYGIEHKTDRVSSEYLGDAQAIADWAWNPAVAAFKEEGRLWGAYVQGHFQVSDPLLISAGVRYDDYDLEQVTYDSGTSSQGFSGNIGLKYAFTDTLSLTAGHAQAFRGKEVGDAFTLERRPGRITLAPNLEPERVDNTEVGLTYKATRLRGSASLYQMTIDDVIMDQIGAGAPPQDATYYENVGKFETKGFELRVGYSWPRVSADVFYTTYDSELNGRAVEGYEEIGLANASGDQWNLNVAWQAASNIDTGFNVRHVQALNDIPVLYRAREIGWIADIQRVDKPSYTVADIFIDWKPKGLDRLRVNIAVQNLFDVKYRDHASVADYNHIPDWEGIAGVYEAGRDVRVSLAYEF
ncbi:TonB-dependent receptor domain-containing protein [Asticcacaulis endophyticus]|uniref:Ligand-gated channel n=1 Tax=Asticcacaulis endophyticus TaxID=1395890 RepID=A0A918QCY9_9CAUL|nr:TonB-dependent receptor [Asticcacaulis endophyticus]GGZ39064.1 ligand-gated channel [Asticcacaulis endophyticus]